MKITTLQRWQAFWHRYPALSESEWTEWEKLTDEILGSAAFQEMPLARQKPFQQLWERRKTLEPQETQRLNQWFRTLKQDIQLQDLWHRRDTLTETEWRHLYQLIYQILQANTFKMPQSLPEEPTVYIHDFFTRKVLEPCRHEGFQAGSKIHTGAICVYFNRFLRDRLRENQTLELRSPKSQKEAVDIIELLESIAVDPLWNALTEPSPDMAAVLNESGLTIEKVSRAAQTLLSQLEPSDRLLLKCGFCASDEQRIPVSRFTGVIPTPAYHARRLGITRGGKQFPDYQKTVLGSWLTSSRAGLGLSLSVENREVLMATLKILCWHSLIDEETDCKRISGPSP